MEECRIIDLNRNRACFAYERLSDLKEEICNNYKTENPEDVKKIVEQQKKVKSICRKLPAMIQVNSLITVLCHLSKKGNEEEKEKTDNGQLVEKVLSPEEAVADIMSVWLKQFIKLQEQDSKEVFTYLISKKNGEENFLCDRKEYVFLTNEALQLSIWLKKNAEMIFD